MAKVITDKDKIREVLERGVEEVIDKEHLGRKLKSGRQLRVKLGIDPTSPNIHIGRAIPLFKLKDFQELGHKVVLIIGDFTGIIGDTSDKDSERPMLTEKEVKENLKNYIQQAGKVIDIKKCEVRYNSKWLGKLGYHEIGKQANVFSLNEFISRENIRKRLDDGKRISLRELLYPLMQGYDSVAIKADVEIGGTDQRFNLLAGRELQRYYGQEPQDIMTNPLIEGLDGRKMSSSWGNTINLLDSANEIYGKIMSLRDELIIKYFILTTRLDAAEIEKYQKEIEAGANPRDLKMKLAYEIVKIYHGEKKAREAQDYFIKTVQKKEVPSDVQTSPSSAPEISIIDYLVEAGLAKSRSDARRKVEQGGVSVGDKRVESIGLMLNSESDNGKIVKVGKRNYKKIVF